MDVELREAFDEMQGRMDDIRRHMDVVAEGLRGDIRQVAEGVLLANERIDRLDAKVELYQEENRAEFQGVRTLLK